MTDERRDHRHRAREAALQMLYQWEVGRMDVADVVSSYWHIDRPDEAPLAAPLEAFATSLVTGTVSQVEQIDPLIVASAEHWRLSRMAIVDRLILRLAVYEFLHDPAMPKKVIINEALELARTYGSDDSVKFVNGLLDGITRRLEEDEERGERKEERGKRKEEGEASPRTTDDTPRDATTDDDRQDD